MKSFKLILATSLCLGALSCANRTPFHPRPESRLVVFVHWGDVGVADRRIVLVEVGQERWTDANGIAEFVVPPGQYTVRAYGINEPGPPPLHVDLEVTLVAWETRRVEIEDCLPCVAAR